MLGVIEGNAAGVEGWDIANVFPGGGGNWGGSYLTVPAQGKNQAEAKKLAAWLTAPEQQIKAFTAKGTFPSQVEALTSEALLGQTNAFFNDAPTGEIFAERAKAVGATPFKGPKFFPINDAMQQALTRVDVDKSDDAASSWEKFVTAVKSLLVMSVTDRVKPQGPTTDESSTDAKKIRRVALSQQLSRWDVKLSPYLYISPFFLLFAITGLFPLLYTGWVSLHNWNLIGGQGEFVGAENFGFVLAQPYFWNAVGNTLSIFLLSSVPQVVLALLIAAVLDANLRAKTFWRMGVLVPFVVAPVAVGLIFNNLFADQFGLVNNMLGFVGIDPVRWHSDPLASHWRSPRWSTSAGPATTPSFSSPRCRPSRATSSKQPPSTAPAGCVSSSRSPCRCFAPR